MMPSGAPKTLLVVASDAETQALALEQAKPRGLAVIVAPDPPGAIAMLDTTVPDVVLSDSTMLEALRAGAIDYLYKPVIGPQLASALDRALQLIPQTVVDVPGIEQAEYSVVIGTDPANVEACVAWLIAETATMLPDTQRLHLRTTLIELIVNAVEHGSLEIFYQEKHEALGNDQYDSLIAQRRRDPQFARRRVIIRACCDKVARSIRYTITDEGSGFGWNGFLTRSDEP